MPDDDAQHDDHTDDDAGSIDFDRVVQSLDELLEACHCSDLLTLEGLVEDYVDGCMFVWGEGNPGGCGDGDIEVCHPELGRGSCFTFPFAVGELFDYADDFQAMFLIEDELLDLAAEIAAVEGFEVELELDPDCADVPPRLRRRVTMDGVMVQNIMRYGFGRAMPGDATFGEWLQQRLFRDNPGLLVVEGSHDDHVPLAAVRGEIPMPPPLPGSRRHPRGRG